MIKDKYYRMEKRKMKRKHKSIGQNLLEILRLQRVSKQILASRINMSYQTIHFICIDQNLPSKLTLDKICKALRVFDMEILGANKLGKQALRGMPKIDKDTHTYVGSSDHVSLATMLTISGDMPASKRLYNTINKLSADQRVEFQNWLKIAKRNLE